ESDFGARTLTDEQYVYAGNDARYLPALAEHLCSELAAAGMEEVSALEMDLISWAAEAELTGIPADAQAMDEAIQRRARAQESLATQIEGAMQTAGFDTAPFYKRKRKRDPLTLNVNSTLLKKAFFSNREDEEGNTVILPLTPKDQPSFTEEA